MLPLSERTVSHVLMAAVDRKPDHAALRDSSNELTYEQTAERSGSLAAGLRSLGVVAGEPVAVMLDDSLDSVVLWLGLCFLAAVEVPVNTEYKGTMLAQLLRESGVEKVVIEECYLDRFGKVLPECPLIDTVIVHASPNAPPRDFSASGMVRVFEMNELTGNDALSPMRLDPWDPMAIYYTSGTTGPPKGFLTSHAHGFAIADPTSCGTMGPEDTKFVVLPQFHIAGRCGGILQAFIAQGTAYVAARFSASGFWDETRTAQATMTHFVGTQPDFLWAQPPRGNDAENPIREVLMLPLISHLREFEERFGVTVVTSYGTSECGTVLRSLHLDDRQSVGRPVDGYEVVIADEHDVPVLAGVVGEALVRPKLPWTTTTAYLGNPEKTLQTWRNGWFHTGDALYRNEEGEYFFVERMSDAIRRRGENIPSATIEQEIVAHPDVAEGVVVAVPSEYTEDEIKAVVVCKSGSTLTESALVEFLAERIPAFMVPRYVEFVTELPRSATNKIQKAALRATGTASAWDGGTGRIGRQSAATHE
jgi:crotonobetaine/carnitine-CoA ligase